MKPTFFSSFLVLNPTSDTFSRNLFHFSLRTPLFAQHEGFSDSGFPFLHPLPHLHISIDFLSALHSPSLFTTPPLSFSFLPTFPSPSPINARSRAHSRTTRVHVRPHIPTHQEVFVFSFTASPTLLNPLYINTLGVKENKKKPSQNAQYPYNQNINTKYPISSTVNSICHRGEAIYHHREHKNQKPSPLMLCETTICGIPVKR